jgi:Zn-dependent protease with chaperone function
MVVNPALILVSALFFLALASLFYLVAWGVAGVGLRVGHSRLSHAASKRLLMLCLAMPPVLAMIPTFGGATLRHSHMTPLVEHHSPACRQMFVHLFSAETMTGTAMTVSEVAGRVVNGGAWLLVGIGVFFLLRLLWATLKLENGLTAYLNAPSVRLRDALTRVRQQMPGLAASRFYECALPATYSSVLGLRHVRCILSREFVATATDEELDAVVAHEANHLCAHDVPATFVVGALNCLFFPLRPVRLLARRWREEAELASDDAAVNVTQRPLALAAAILRAVGTPVSHNQISRSLPTIAMPFADESACSASKRVERLIVRAQAALPPPHESRRQVWVGWLTTLTLAGVGAVILLSPEMICYAHCALEAVSRLLP